MSWIDRFSLLRRSGSARASGKRAPRHQLALGAVTPEAGVAFLAALRRAEANGIVLVGIPPDDASRFSETSPVDCSVMAPELGLSGTRQMRVYLAVAGAPAAEGAQRDASAEARTAWMKADTLAIVWDLSQADTGRINHLILSSLASRAHALGRLLRVVVVITGMPAPGPRHGSQAWLELPAGDGVQQGFEAVVTAASNQPGNPLADREWVAAARSALSNGGLRSLIETVRRATRRAVPVMFTAGGSAIGAERLIAWVVRGRAARRAWPDRIGLSVRVAAVVLLVAATLTCALVPWERGQDLRKVPPSRLLSILMSGQGFARAGLPAPRGANADSLVSRAIAVLRDQQETDSMRLALEMHRTSALAGIDTLLEPGRAARAARLEQELATSLQRFATRAKRIAREGPLSKCDLIWSRTMGSTALTVAVLHLQAVNEGFGGYRLQQRDLARLRQALAACNRQDLFPAFRRLLATRPASQFYKTYLRLSASRSPMGAAFEPIRPALPRIRLDRAGVTPLADPSVSLASWRERRVEFPVLLGREFVPFVTMAGDAASVEQASLPPPGPMVLRLRRPGDWSWHAHVRGAGLPIWATTEWGDPPSPTDGCVVTLPSAVVGSVLEIRFNFDDAECAEPDERGASPCASGAAVRLVLSRPSGSVAAPDGRTIYWEIVSGWPQPPVAASGGGQ